MSYQNTLHYWMRHGQHSRYQWQRCIPKMCRFGPFLNLPHSTNCIPKRKQYLVGTWCLTCSSLLTGTNWAMPHRTWKSLMLWLGLHIGYQVHLTKDGILCNSESLYKSDPWTITTVSTNGTIRVKCRTKSEQLKIRRVRPFLMSRHKVYMFFYVLSSSPIYNTYA
jgi:hypothetical protein